MKIFSIIILATYLLNTKIIQSTFQNKDLIVGKWVISKRVEITDGKSRKKSLKGYSREFTFFETGKFILFSVNTYDEKLVAHATLGHWKVEDQNKLFLTDLGTIPASPYIKVNPPDICWRIVKISPTELILQDSSAYTNVQFRSFFKRIKEK